jgi:hypothetical protein|tara:strand:+ start:151 stop:378 length:228 start_codon:yes stop_codon:yes gene_type:complete
MPKIKVNYRKYMINRELKEKFHALLDSMAVDLTTNLYAVKDTELRKKLNFIVQDYRNRIYKLELDDAAETVKKNT